MGPIHTLRDFLDMVRRRIGLISFVVIVGCVASVWWALETPHLYQSSEVIQIEQPKIDDDLAPTTVASSSARRLQLIQQQLMARGTLLDIIDELDLYANLVRLRPTEKVNLLRQSVTINGQAAVREGFADDGTISVLTITATMDSAEAAQAVAHEFADRTRALSEEQRREQTRETLDFFLRQEEALTSAIAELEDELTAYRRENELSIAGNAALRRDELAGLNEAILELDREIIAAQLSRNRIDRSQREETIAREEAAADAAIDSLTTQRGLLVDRRATLSASLETTPEVERAIAAFDRRMDQLQGQLDVVSTRRGEAEVGFTLESGARGERLITIEEAPLPDYPISMSRKRRAAMGAVAALMLGLALAFVLDLRKPVVRTAQQMERETGLRPVVSIPDMRRERGGIFAGPRRLWQMRRDNGKRGRLARLARMKALNKG